MIINRTDLFRRAVSSSRDDENQRIADTCGLTLSQVRWLRSVHKLDELYDETGQLITRTRRQIEGRHFPAYLVRGLTDAVPDSCGRNPAIARDILARMEDPPEDGPGRLMWLMRHREFGSTAR